MRALPPKFKAREARPMRIVKIRVEQASFADTLNAMREWLDRKNCYLAHFRHLSGDDGIIVISAGFAKADDPRVDEFERQFSGVR
jgi:hypothetical protein